MTKIDVGLIFQDIEGGDIPQSGKILHIYIMTRGTNGIYKQSYLNIARAVIEPGKLNCYVTETRQLKDSFIHLAFICISLYCFIFWFVSK